MKSLKLRTDKTQNLEGIELGSGSMVSVGHDRELKVEVCVDEYSCLLLMK